MDRVKLTELVSTVLVPHSYFAADESEVRNYLLERLLADIDNDHLQFWTAEDKTAAVLVAASVQDWDSRLLGFGCAHLDWVLAAGSAITTASLLASLGGEVVAWCQNANVKLLSCKVDSERLPLVHGLQEWGLKLVDCEMVWALDQRRVRPIIEDIPNIVVENTRGEEIDGIGALGRAFALDRFHSDYRIDAARASALWTESLHNACKERADQVVFARAGRTVIGVVTCFLARETARYLTEPVCDLVHVAVDPDWRGRGVGMAMLERAIAWAGAETEFVQVGTQARNYAASALYRKMGFALVDSQYSMHAHWPL